MRRRLATLALLLFAIATPSASEIFELPVELELAAGPVFLDLDNAVLDVALRPGEASVLWARPQSTDGPVAVSLELITESGGVRVSRPGAEDASASRMQLELVIDPQWPVRLAGADLDIVFDGHSRGVGIRKGDHQDDDDGDDDEDEDEDDGDDEEDGDEDDEDLDERGPASESEKRRRSDKKPTQTEEEVVPIFVVDRSSLNLIGLNGARIEATDSFLRIERTTGTVRAQIERGTTEVDDHQGILELSARESETWLDETKGNVVFSLQGGSLILRRGIGRCDGDGKDARVQLENWRGPVAFEGTNTTFDALASVSSPLRISGDDLAVTVQDFRGSLEPSLRGGTLSVRTMSGPVRLEAMDGAEVVLDELKGAIVLDLRGESNGRLSEIDGLLRAEVYGARLEVRGARRLQIEASDADLVVSDLKQIAVSEIIDSRLDLDLTALQHNPTLTLGGRSEAWVRLKTPCSVNMSGANGSFAAVEVTGCLVHYERRARQGANSRGIDGNSRVILTAEISEESSLEVEGLP